MKEYTNPICQKEFKAACKKLAATLKAFDKELNSFVIDFHKGVKRIGKNKTKKQ